MDCTGRYLALAPEALARARAWVQAGMPAVPAAAARAPRLPKVRDGAIAVLPLLGFLSQRGSWLDGLFGGTSIDAWAAAFQAAVDDTTIGAVVADVDSLGGEVYGMEGTAALIRAARGKKPLIAVANSTAVSGGYYLASQFDQLVIVPGGQVGSIGVILFHEDRSGLEKKTGIKEEIIAAGPYKAMLWENVLSDAARADLQAYVDTYYDAFLTDVSKGRGVSKSKVASDFGQGRSVLAGEAVAAGMVDRVATFAEVIDQLLPPKKPEPGRPAHALALARRRLELEKMR